MSFKRDMESISELIQQCNSIEEVIGIMRANSNIVDLDIFKFKYLHLEVAIDFQNFILSKELKILTDEDLQRDKFELYIQYNIDDIREGRIKPIECRLMKCKSLQEQIELIENYLAKPYRRFKKWSTKPNKLFLYHTYGESSKEFQISYV